MAKNDRKNGYVERHKSALLILCLFVLGLLFAVLGISAEAGLTNFLGKFLVELSITLLVGCIAALFLSLRDVREQLASVLGTLFSEGKIAGLLSITARELLSKELVQTRLGTGIVSIDEELLGGLNQLIDECLRSVHLRNFSIALSIQPHPTNPAFHAQQTAITFRIDISHLSSPLKFPYKYKYQIDLPFGATMTDDEFLLEFRLRVGGTEFTEKKIRRDQERGVCALKFDFEKIFDLTAKSTFVELNYTAARLKSDNISVSRARYPTRGFEKTLNYTDGFDYDCKWFASIGEKAGESVVGGTSSLIGTGIKATRDDWVLPGEGIAISWTPKPGIATLPANTNPVSR